MSLIRADARFLPIADGVVSCCVTSPPYWGLRDYGNPKQIGLEQTPEAFTAALVDVFREVRRVLKDDGTAWINLGDSYAAGAGKVGECPGGGAQGDRWKGYRGTRDGDPKNGFSMGPLVQPNRMPLPGLKAKDLIGIPWRVAFALQQPYEVVRIKDRADRAWMAALVDGEGCITTNMAQPTTGINESYAVIVQVRMSDRECLDRIVEITGMSHVQAENLSPSMETGNQRPASCWKIAGENAATVLAEIYPYLRIKKRQALAAWNLQRLKDGIVTKRGIAIPAENMELRRDLHRVIRALNQRESVDVPGWCREPEYTIEPGWYLRSDVIWSKPNPMPESVTDRPTKAHEYLFLLSKSKSYHYDAKAIAEPYAEATLRDREADGGLYSGEATKDYKAAGAQNPSDVKRRIAAGIQRKNEQSGDRRKVGFNDRWDATERKAEGTPRNDGARWGTVDGGVAARGSGTAVGGRNKRTVWTIPMQPYSGSHFATFPEALVEPCILAGCPLGGLVLDPFIGSGTVGAVAERLGRRWVGVDLNYQSLSKKRTAQRGLMFTEASA